MGLINRDSYSTPYGISVSDTYISIAENEIGVLKKFGTDEYILRYTATIWNSQTDRNNNKKSLKNLTRSISFDPSQGVYIAAYADLKTVFTNTADA